MQKNEKKLYGVIGSGSFGTAIANILSANNKVLMHIRRKEVIEQIEATGANRGQPLQKNIDMTLDIAEVCAKCTLIFLLVPSSNFRSMIQQAAPFLKPHHILIHGTKGLNVVPPKGSSELLPNVAVSRDNVRTMCDIISEETVVLRMGCLSGPNLAKEISAGQPAATVIASRFDEVIEAGKEALKSDRFRVYGSRDVLGVELAGVFKNIIAIASGMVSGLQMGENARAMLITRGLGENIKLSRALGATTRSFLGIAGIGDLIATCSSKLSRNYRVGYGLAQNRSLDDILEELGEVAEGVNTVKLAKGLSLHYQKHEFPIIEALYQVLYEKRDLREAVGELMLHDLDIDADFMDF